MTLDIAQAQAIAEQINGVFVVLVTTIEGRRLRRTVTLSARTAEARVRRARATGSSPAANVVTSDDVASAFRALPVADRRAIVHELMRVRLLPAGKGVRFDPRHVQIEWKV